MLAVSPVRSHKAIVMSTLGLAIGYCAKVGANSFKDNIHFVDIEFNKFKSLVDIRREWLRKIYPEKDVFQRNACGM